MASPPQPEPGKPGAKPPIKRPAKQTAPTMIFPVVGEARYTNDFGDARSQGSHQGNDIMAPRRSIAVAAEAGTVKFHTTSWAAGCMLYLYGRSGMTYLYIHLNNDLGKANDNRGKCVPGTAYAPGLRSGANVAAGQAVGFVGDSGDANGVAPHLHFEMHPRNGSAANPFSYLNRAARILFASAPGKRFTLALNGSVSATLTGRLDLKVASLRSYPGGTLVTNVARTLSISVPGSALVEKVVNGIAAALGYGSLTSARKGQPVQVWTTPAPATLDAQLGRSGSLSAERVVLGKKP